MADEPVKAGVTLTTDQLEKVVAEWMARTTGLASPVRHKAYWGWVPDQGPVLVRMEIESVPNVVPLKKPREKGRR